MKTKQLLLTTTLVIGTAAGLLFAQDNQPPQNGRPPQGNRQGGPGGNFGGAGAGQQGQQGQGGPGGQRMQRPSFPVIDALDANHDGVIDASEIANAAEALKKLDKNGDGKLTP